MTGPGSVLLLRGINLGPSRRISMPDLRAALQSAGYAGVRTYLQSGNVVLESELETASLAERVASLIEARFELEVPVVARTAAELAQVVALNPLGEVATDPKRYQVSFCSDPPAAEAIERLTAALAGEERVVAHGREIYAWHPGGVARSRLWTALAGSGLGTLATARNWTTVTKLHEMVQAPAP